MRGAAQRWRVRWRYMSFLGRREREGAMYASLPRYADALAARAVRRRAIARAMRERAHASAA